MTSYSMHAPKQAPFARAVVQAMRKIYPESIADKSFDNTGLMLEAPFDPIRRNMNSVLLTIDLTKAVADEAIERKDCVIIAYHPIIFRGLRSLTLEDPQQQSLLRLALEGISVYSPHTAVDAAPGGLGDWMADIVSGTPDLESRKAEEPKNNSKPEKPAKSDNLQIPMRPGMQRSYSKPVYPTNWDAEEHDRPTSPTSSHTRSVIQASPNPPEGFESAGVGRIVEFKEPQLLTHLIDRIARGMGTPKGFPIAVPQGKSVDEITVSSVAVCAGSGGSVFRNVNADLFFTGELSHHEALAITEKGGCVITLFHSNSERGFLHRVMKYQLQDALKSEWQKVRDEESQRTDIDEDWADALEDESINVEVSERDRDPYGIAILQESEIEGTPITVT